MNHSEQINELAGALAKAQGQLLAVEKSGNNPFLKSNYITLDGIIAALRAPLAANGLAFIQSLDNDGLTTMVMHESGQWISSTYAIPEPVSQKGINDLQALGISITYIKRYALASLLGINAETDDDAAGAGHTQKRRPAPPRKSLPEGTFKSPTEAIQWGFDQGCFRATVHAANAYAKLKEEKKPASAVEMSALWRADVARRVLGEEPPDEDATPEDFDEDGQGTVDF